MPRLLGFRHPAGAPEDLREPAQRIALSARLAGLAVVLQRTLGRLDRVDALIGDVARVRPPVEKIGPLFRRKRVTDP